MIQTVEAIVDINGQVQILGEIQLTGPRRALVTILEESVSSVPETTLLSEPALADWLKPEEDAAWSHLQQEK